MNVGRPTVSSIVDVELELFRTTAGPASTWKTNQCFELIVKSPYTRPSDYSTFSVTEPPLCNPVTQGVTFACKLKPQEEATTLQFQFSSLDDYAMAQSSLRFTLSNFKIPFSAQTLNKIELRAYSDFACTTGMSSVKIASLTTFPAFLPSNRISIYSSSNILSDTDPSNTLSVTFTPSTTMAPGGAGKIELGIPLWYEVGSTSALMYNPESLHACSSSCMQITSSILQVEYLNILYTDMLPECISGTPITINCTSFFNPIWQDRWYGFYVNIFDNEAPSFKAIERSDFTPFLDATQYLPAPIPIDNFFVEPADTIVNTVSEWTLQLSMTTPMMQECYIRIYWPTDIQFNILSATATGIFLSKSLQTILSSTDYTIYDSTPLDSRKSIVFNGCNSEDSLGPLSFGTIDIRQIRTQVSVKDSEEFSIVIYKDEFLTQLIAVLDPGKVLSSDIILPGQVNQIKAYPLISTVQFTSLIYINFTSSHDLFHGSKVIIKLPEGLLLPEEGSVHQVTGLQTVSSGGSVPSTPAKQFRVIGKSTIEIVDFVLNTQASAPYQFWFALHNIENQLSAKDAGTLEITTYYQSKDNLYFVVDTGKIISSFVATPNTIDAQGSIIINNPTNNAQNVTYTLDFATPSRIPENGFIQVEFPTDLIFTKDQTLIEGACSQLTCKWLTQTSLILKTNKAVVKKERLALVIHGIKNPRTFQPTGDFLITTFDTDGKSLIDRGFRKSVQMQNSGSVSDFSFRRQNQMNGEKTTYIFAIKTDIPVKSDDILSFTVPIQLSLDSEQTSCESSDQILCSCVGSIVEIKLIQLRDPYTLSWTLTNVRNPNSLKPSDPFANIQIVSDQGYLVAQFKTATERIINTEPAPFKELKLIQQSLIASDSSEYIIELTPSNALPATGSIQIVYPKQVSPSLGNQTKCFVTTNSLYSNLCNIDTDKRQIIIKDAFAQTKSYSSKITISLVNMTNPKDNRKASGFQLTTYLDAEMQFVQDAVSDALQPILQCNYPCSTCSADNKSNCTSCYNQIVDMPRYLMSSAGKNLGRCENSCDFGFTSNGSPDRRCVRCDLTCDGCQDQGLVNDIRQCVRCSRLAPLRINATNFCESKCGEGRFLMSDGETCGHCDAPCQTCKGTPQTCTGCNKNSTLPLLYHNRCVSVCSKTSTNVAGQCLDCISPCGTCDGAPTQCTSCDPKQGKDILLSKNCYDVCPVGYVTNFTSRECIGCLPGCDLCSLTNTSYCEVCDGKLALFMGACLGGCPDGRVKKEGQCVEPGLFDLSLMYFPFVITTLIIICLVFAAKLKKKATLVNGKKHLFSTQSSITTICALVAPMQTLVTIVQFVLAFYYGHYLQFFLALGVYLMIFCINVGYLYWLIKNFYSKHSPQVGETKILKNRSTVLITELNQSLYEYSDFDPEFRIWVDKHRTSTYCLFVLVGGCHFKMSKLLYSHFFMFDMFKARWTRATYFRETMLKWQLVYVFAVDLSVVAVSAWGLYTIPWSNQLFICMMESILLALLLITVEVIEKCHIKRIFMYTELTLQVKSAEDMQKFKLRKLKNKVRGQLGKQNTFRVKKMEELLRLFGERRCKSCTELRDADFEQQEDERQTFTWPVSPQEAQLIHSANIQFTSADTYEKMDNCYTEGVSKPSHKDMNTQCVDPNSSFVQDAWSRKQNLLVSNSMLNQDTDQLQRLRTQRKRGRKNKYYNQIDQEDSDHIVDASQDDIYQRLIQQQEEEETALKQIVSEETSKQQQREQERKQRKQQEKQRVREMELETQRQLMEAHREEQQRIFMENEARRLEELRQQEERQAEELRLQIETEFLQLQLQKQVEKERIQRERQAEEQRRAAERAAQEQRQREVEAQRQAQIAEQARLKQLEVERVKLEKRREEERRLEEMRQLQLQQELLRQQEIEQERLLREEIREQKRVEAQREQQAVIGTKRQSRLNDEALLREYEMRQAHAESLRQQQIEQADTELQRQQQQQLRLEQREREESEREKLLQLERVESERQQAVVREEERIKQERFERAEQERFRVEQIMQAERAQFEIASEERKQRERMDQQLRLQQEALLGQQQHRQEAMLGQEEYQQEQSDVQKRAVEYAQQLVGAVSVPSDDNQSLVYETIASQHQRLQTPIDYNDPESPAIIAESFSLQTLVQKPIDYPPIEPKEYIQPHEETIDYDVVSPKAALLQKKASHTDLVSSVEKLRLIEQKQNESMPILYQSIVQPESKRDFQSLRPSKMRSTTRSEPDDPRYSTMIALNQDAMKNFQGSAEDLIQVPPDAGKRLFNEHDVLGDCERDEKANVVVLTDEDGDACDRQGNSINQRGYLLNDAGDVLENLQGRVMFPQVDLDDRGELPAPFSIEKHNFNAHSLMGYFDYLDGEPQIIRQGSGNFIDKNKRRVNESGWYVQPGQSHLIDKDHRKKFDKRQLVAPRFDDLPKLFNYQGKRFDIRDVMGEFEKDQKGCIILQQTQDGYIIDNQGRFCNERGYLTDDEGNIVDQKGRQLWKATDLKNGEFIKIFPFTKFNISKVYGEVAVSANGNPILEKQHNGQYLDRMGRPVNARGYLIDQYYNVIDVNGKLMFDRIVLEKDGEIPAVFRSGLLRQDTASSISRLMSEIERNNLNQSDMHTINQLYSGFEDHTIKRPNDSDTSLDSKMEDTPANYNFANQRFEQDSDFMPIPEMLQKPRFELTSDFSENAHSENPAIIMQPKSRKDKKKPPKVQTRSTIEFQEPEVSRQKVKKENQGGNKFRETDRAESRVRPQLKKLAHSDSNNMPVFETKKQGLMGDSVQSKQQNQFQLQQELDVLRQEPNYEQQYGKDIDQFLDDSEWDIDNFNLEKVSASSDDIQHKVTTDLKLAAMEKHYLNSNTTISPRMPDQTNLSKNRQENTLQPPINPLKQNRRPIPTEKFTNSVESSIQTSHLDSLQEPSLEMQQSSTVSLKKKKKKRKEKSIQKSPLTESLQRKSQGRISPNKMGPARETIISTTDDPQVIHRGEILEFETKKR